MSRVSLGRSFQFLVLLGGVDQLAVSAEERVGHLDYGIAINVMSQKSVSAEHSVLTVQACLDSLFQTVSSPPITDNADIVHIPFLSKHVHE